MASPEFFAATGAIRAQAPRDGAPYEQATRPIVKRRSRPRRSQMLIATERGV